ATVDNGISESSLGSVGYAVPWPLEVGCGGRGPGFVDGLATAAGLSAVRMVLAAGGSGVCRLSHGRLEHRQPLEGRRRSRPVAVAGGGRGSRATVSHVRCLRRVVAASRRRLVLRRRPTAPAEPASAWLTLPV